LQQNFAPNFGQKKFPPKFGESIKKKLKNNYISQFVFKLFSAHDKNPTKKFTKFWSKNSPNFGQKKKSPPKNPPKFGE